MHDFFSFVQPRNMQNFNMAFFGDDKALDAVIAITVTKGNDNNHSVIWHWF